MLLWGSRSCIQLIVGLHACCLNPSNLQSCFGVQGEGKEGVRAYLEMKGLAQISDVGALEAIVDKVLSSNPKQLQEYCGGKAKLQGFFVGCAAQPIHAHGCYGFAHSC